MENPCKVCGTSKTKHNSGMVHNYVPTNDVPLLVCNGVTLTCNDANCKICRSHLRKKL